VRNPPVPIGLEDLAKQAQKLAAHCSEMNRYAIFMNRGFSIDLVKALADLKIEAPEQLLFMSLEEVQRLPGIGVASHRQIAAYRSKFGRT
jgi:hypothetical protein